jgi:hypothetical protein
MSVVNNNNYKYNNSTGTSSVSISPPPGSVIAYMGTSDPDGWIICNGTQRNNGADGRYNNLIAMGIGSGSANASNYTPPNYKGAFLRGTGTGSDVSNVGPTLGSSQSDAIRLHNHAIQYPFNTRSAVAEGSNFDYFSPSGTNFTNPDYYTTQTGSTETRPYNYGVNWIIKL